jgi:hypothetical protein
MQIYIGLSPQINKRIFENLTVPGFEFLISYLMRQIPFTWNGNDLHFMCQQEHHLVPNVDDMEVRIIIVSKYIKMHAVKLA